MNRNCTNLPLCNFAKGPLRNLPFEQCVNGFFCASGSFVQAVSLHNCAKGPTLFSAQIVPAASQVDDAGVGRSQTHMLGVRPMYAVATSLLGTITFKVSALCGSGASDRILSTFYRTECHFLVFVVLQKNVFCTIAKKNRACQLNVLWKIGSQRFCCLF